MSSRSRSTQRGIAVLLFAAMSIFVVGCLGLAVDVGTIYMIKARLSAAVDAAALAAGRSVNLASTVGQATTTASTTASQFFAANFPTGYFNSIGAPTVTPSFSEQTDANGNPAGLLNITVTANVSAPTYFMNIFNVHNVTVSATGTATRRGLVLMLVLDQSSSMGSGAGSPCEVMKSSAENFIGLLSPYDEVGLVTFDITAHLMDAPSVTHSGVLNDIAAIACQSNTNTISALEMAYQQIRTTNLPLALNTIVLFTDGSPNGITANFPARAAVDSRWGYSLNPPAPPAQSGSTYGIANSCANGVGVQDANGNWSNGICVNMPVVCTSATATFQGTLAQWGAQNSYGAATYGLAPPTDGASVTIPPSCSYTSTLPATTIRQFIAYIPDTDIYGNSLHGVSATGTSTYGTVTGGYDTRDYWLFQVNNLCSPDPSITPNCRNTGGPWSSYSSTGSGSNMFPSGSTYHGYFRPDQPNSVVAASMNGTMAEANKIRSDTTFHPVINTIYLTGNATDAVDREFLAIVANAPQITALPYDPVNFVPYPNPAFQSTQASGKYLVTADRNELTSLFAQMASEVLRLSQ